jgi:PmbA protein
LRDLKRTAGREAGEIAAMAKNPEKGEEGTYTVMFSPLAFANILSHVAHASSAFSVDNGMSFLAGKLGDTIGSEQFTFIDTGLHPNGIASRAFDDEGLTTMETTIFEKGTLNSYLHNTSTALNYKTQTTRNAGLISPMPWNSFVVPGEVTEKEMMKDMKAGIYVTNVWYTRFQNYLTGEFSTLPRDGIFQVKKGEISQPLKEVRISDNMCHLLSNIKALSNTQAQIYWWEVDVPTFTPYALIKDVKITRPFA